jgi:hypothetical protein
MPDPPVMLELLDRPAAFRLQAAERLTRLTLSDLHKLAQPNGRQGGDASHVRAPQHLNSLLLDGLVSNAQIELRRHVWDLRRRCSDQRRRE